MTHNSNDPLRALEREVQPPSDLKAQVSCSLRSRGLLRRARPSSVWRGAGLLAAGVVLFAAGRATARPGIEVPDDGKRSYALMLYEDEGFDRTVPGVSYIAEYSAWAAGLRERGALAGGEPLDSAAVLLTGAGVEGRDVTSEAGTLSGFFIIRATDQAEALAIAKTCPHLRHGGRIALRPVVPT